MRGSSREEYPNRLHLYANKANLGFEDMQGGAVPPLCTLEDTAAVCLQPEGNQNEEGILPIPKQTLSLKFNRVSTLTIFVEESIGGVVSSIGGIQIWGCLA